MDHGAKGNLFNIMSKCIGTAENRPFQRDVLQGELGCSDLEKIALSRHFIFLRKWEMMESGSSANTWMRAMWVAANDEGWMKVAKIRAINTLNVQGDRDMGAKAWKKRLDEFFYWGRRGKIEKAYSKISQRYGDYLMGERPVYKKLLMQEITKTLGRRVIFSMRLGTFLHSGWARRLRIAHQKERQPNEVSHDCLVCRGSGDSVDHALWLCNASEEARERFKDTLSGRR